MPLVSARQLAPHSALEAQAMESSPTTWRESQATSASTDRTSSAAANKRGADMLEPSCVMRRIVCDFGGPWGRYRSLVDGLIVPSEACMDVVTTR